MSWITIAVLSACGSAGAWLLRRSWADRRRERPASIAGGWAMIVAALAIGVVAIGPVKGLAIAASAVAIGALAIVALGRVRRQARAEREASLAPEPLGGPSRAWRGWVKALLAGPLGMTAAMGVAFCYATWVPGDPRTRIVIGGLLMPVLWALAMTWTLADQRLLRSLAVLTGVTILGFGAATLGSLA